jgi:hypothetical protein
MKPTVERDWFERRVRLEEGLDVAAGLPQPEVVSDSADEPAALPLDERPCDEGARTREMPVRREPSGKRRVRSAST